MNRHTSLWMIILLIPMLFSACSREYNPSEQSLEKYTEALFHYQEGRVLQAREILQAVVEEEKKHFPQAKVLLGKVQFLSGEMEEAQQLFLQVYQRDNSQQDAGLWLLKSYIQRENWEKARELGSRLLSRDPEDPRLLLQMGNLYMNQTNYSRALEYYQAATAYSEELALAYLRQGELFLDMENYGQAALSLERALEVVPVHSPMADPITNLYHRIRTIE